VLSVKVTRVNNSSCNKQRGLRRPPRGLEPSYQNNAPPPFNWLNFPTLTLSPRLAGVVADVHDTTPDEPQHPNLALIIECGDEFARIVVPTTVWPLEKRDLLAVDRPVAVTGQSDVDPFRHGARAVATSLQLLDPYH
jgi:hypothetical protein